MGKGWESSGITDKRPQIRASKVVAGLPLGQRTIASTRPLWLMFTGNCSVAMRMQEGGGSQAPPGSPVAGIVPSTEKHRCFLAHVSSPGSGQMLHPCTGRWGSNMSTPLSAKNGTHSSLSLPSTAIPNYYYYFFFWEGEHRLLTSWKGVLFLICTLWEVDHTLLGTLLFDGLPKWHIYSLCCDLSLPSVYPHGF